MSRHHHLICLATALATFTGCASGPDNLPYRAPDPGQATVALTVLPPRHGLSRHESEQLNRHAVDCQSDGQWTSRRMDLAHYRSLSKDPPAAVVALPVGRVYFSYVRMNNNESCALNFSARLEAGHAYAMKTQNNYGGIFKRGECMLLMVDTNTGTPVQLDRESATPDFGPMCRKQSVALATSGASAN
jgi:hypothetical protein